MRLLSAAEMYCQKTPAQNKKQAGWKKTGVCILSIGNWLLSRLCGKYKGKGGSGFLRRIRRFSKTDGRKQE